MKIRHSLLTAGSVLALATSASALTKTFTPSDADLADLDHHYAYTWGIDFAIPAGEKIKSVSLRIENIWDWKVENDKLFIQLLDDPRTGIRTYEDNTNDNVISDWFETNYNGTHTALTSWTDPVGGVNNGFDFEYAFTQAQIDLLTSYITDPQVQYRAEFGLGFDPDCHYYNSGITLKIETCPVTVPDNGTTVALLGLALTAVAGTRRFVRA